MHFRFNLKFVKKCVCLSDIDHVLVNISANSIIVVKCMQSSSRCQFQIIIKITKLSRFKNGSWKVTKAKLPPIRMVVFTLINVRAWSILLFSCILLQTIEAIYWLSKIQQLIIGCSLFVLGMEEIDRHHGWDENIHTKLILHTWDQVFS